MAGRPRRPWRFRRDRGPHRLRANGHILVLNGRLNRLRENTDLGPSWQLRRRPDRLPSSRRATRWTGDLQAFAPTAAFLYDVSGFVAEWLEDLRAEPFDDGRVPLVVPAGPPGMFPMGTFCCCVGRCRHESSRGRCTSVSAIKGCSHASWTPCGPGWSSYGRRRVTGSCGPRSPAGDWLDPDAPPDQPWRAKTDAVLVATAYFARSAQLVGRAAQVLGRSRGSRRVRAVRRRRPPSLPQRVRHCERAHRSDSVTAYALAIVFDLYEDPAHRARHRQAHRRTVHGPPVHHFDPLRRYGARPASLSAVGDLTTAYRLLTETECPSWLYPVTMGATTMWERWDSMLPDGSINPGEMTSFNHYAFGGVADWMQQTIGGLSAYEPGYRVLRFSPAPGGGVHPPRVHCARRTVVPRAGGRSWISA